MRTMREAVHPWVLSREDLELMQDQEFEAELHWAHLEGREYNYATPCD